jgi:hypothetical protein
MTRSEHNVGQKSVHGTNSLIGVALKVPGVGAFGTLPATDITAGEGPDH